MMAEIPSTALDHLTPHDLCTITPSSVVATSLLSGKMAIKWPFSSSAQKLTFLLVDPDPRKRAQGGQVKITLLGDAAKYLDQIESGEQISIAALENMQAPLVDPETETPRTKDDSPAKRFPPPPPKLPAKSTPIERLPRVSAPPVKHESSPPLQPRTLEAPPKRKFKDFADEEERFGSTPRDSRRISGPMRFIRPDGETSTSTPARKSVTDENSFEPRGTTGRVSPALVSQAQSLISPEISSDKLLLPQRGTGTRRMGIELGEVSHAAAMGEESTRPAIAGEFSKRSVGETNFEVSMDEDEPDEDEGDVSAEELMRPSQRGQWNVPASYVSEKRLPTSSRSKELEPSEDSDVVEDGIQVGNTAIRSEGEFEEEEEEEEGNEDYEESGVLVEFSSRRYHQPEHDHEYAAEDELSGSDRVDYHQPESYIDDEELSGEDSEEEDELRHAKYYSQTRAGRQEEEEYYNSEEEDEAEVHLQHYGQDEYILHSDDEKQEDRDRESYSWQGIGNTTPFTDLSHLPSHHQSPQVTQLLDPLLDQPTQSYPLTQRAVQNHRNDGDLHNPAMFYIIKLK